MAIKLILSSEDKNILNEALRQYALPTMNKKKQTMEEKKFGPDREPNYANKFQQRNYLAMDKMGQGYSHFGTRL